MHPIVRNIFRSPKELLCRNMDDTGLLGSIAYSRHGTFKLFEHWDDLIYHWNLYLRESKCEIIEELCDEVASGIDIIHQGPMMSET